MTTPWGGGGLMVFVSVWIATSVRVESSIFFLILTGYSNHQLEVALAYFPLLMGLGFYIESTAAL